MNLHAVVTDDTIDDAALLAALEAAGIDAQVKPATTPATMMAWF